MTVEVSAIRDIAELEPLLAEWRQLAVADGGSLFRGPDWIVPWWRAYHQTLGAEAFVLVGHNQGALIFVAPLYARTVKLAMLEARELRLMGDAGPRPPALDIVVKAGWEDRAGSALARKLLDVADDWDMIELEPLADPSRLRAMMVSRMSAAGFSVESAASAGGARRVALGGQPPTEPTASDFGHDASAMRKGMSALRRLSRLEWAERDEASPLADAEAGQLLDEVAVALGEQGKARVVHLDDASGETAAAAMVIDDGDRAVLLAMAVDPLVMPDGAPQRLFAGEAAAALARGKTALDVVTGAHEYPLPPLPVSRFSALSVRIWSTSKTAHIGRAYRSMQRRAKRAVTSPVIAAAQARAAWTRIRSAATSVAGLQRMCLYRGQLWTRGVEPPPGTVMKLFSAADFEALGPVERVELIEQLELNETAAQTYWARGDLAVIAEVAGRPAGIAWSARGPTEVPELGRTLQLSKYEAYIHDVFVATAARGRGLAPIMLEFLAKNLRERDAYRSWALIAPDNHASMRAFKKAAYTPVCDVVHGHLASVDHVIVRPPDPEAKALLGL
jgi:GNAT superfamily N-acetyltransferase